MRKDAREAVYKLLFSNQFNDKFDDDFKNYIYLDCNLSKEDITFADELIDNFYKNEEEINQLIAELSKGYKLDRIFVTDKCAMQIAICEITYLKNIPIIVSISEAMELVRKYSTPESPNFVNGILAEYKKRVEEKKWFY